MAIASDLLSLMTQTVVWTTGGTMSNYGVPTFGSTGHAMSARVTLEAGETRDRDGNSLATQGTVWCASTGSTFIPSPDDRIVLPDGRSVPVVTVNILRDEDGLHHFKAILGF